LTGNFKSSLQGSGKGASLFAGALLGGSFLGTWKDMERRAQGTDITLHRGPAEEFSRGLVYRGLVMALEMGTFLHRGPVKYHGGSVHRELWEIVERGVWKRGHFLYGSTVRGTWRGVPLLRGTKCYERKALGKGISPLGGSVGQPGVDSSTGDFEMWLKGALEVECLSLWEFCEGNLEGALFCWGP